MVGLLLIGSLVGFIVKDLGVSFVEKMADLIEGVES
jgi:hypothetical protein